MRKRVFLYIVKNDKLLVLRHVDFPDIGLQIPGGTVEPNETCANAASREAEEETGLTELSVPKYLDTVVFPSLRSNEKLLEAWYYHIEALGDVPQVWLHTEQHASGGEKDIRFELSWLPLDKAKEHLSESDSLMLDAVVGYHS